MGLGGSLVVVAAVLASVSASSLQGDCRFCCSRQVVVYCLLVKINPCRVTRIYALMLYLGHEYSAEEAKNFDFYVE